MKDSTFNPIHQQKDISSKIVSGLERISEVFKVLLWEKAKLLGLGPIQIQILIFIKYHKDVLCNVSYLSKEFNVTKPTISHAIRSLDNKGMIEKDFSLYDGRSYLMSLSNLGEDMVDQVNDYSLALKKPISNLSKPELEGLFSTISELIYKLNRSGVLTVQRTCYGCRFYQKTDKDHYCNLLQMDLLDQDIRLDCPEYEEKNQGERVLV